MQVYQQNWVSLPIEVRQKLAEAFNLRRDEGTNVKDNQVRSDGYSDLALSAITIEAMQAFLNTEIAEFETLFDMCVNHQPDGLVEPISAPVEATPAIETPVIETPAEAPPVVETPTEATLAIETPVEPVVEAPVADVPLESPVEPVVETPVEAPVADVEVPAEKPVKVGASKKNSK